MTNKDYVTPPKKSDYVSPPKKNNQANYVKAPQKSSQASVKVPPKSSQSSYVAPPNNNQVKYVAPQQNTYVSENKTTELPRQNVNQYNTNTIRVNSESVRGYFDTPEVGIKFYMTLYLFISLYLFWTGNFSTFESILWTLYTLISNYTYCWFAEYNRVRGGSFAWFFRPLSGVRGATYSAQFGDFSKARTTRSMWGGYTTRYSSGNFEKLGFIAIVSFILEFFKYIIVFPLAFLSLFLHKRTIREYRKLISRY